jgi:hypothetical protein
LKKPTTALPKSWWKAARSKSGIGAPIQWPSQNLAVRSKSAVRPIAISAVAPPADWPKMPMRAGSM